LLSPTSVEALKRRSPDINWYLLKSNFLTVIGNPNSLMDTASSLNDSLKIAARVEKDLFQ
jgi:hypothetical protein